MKTTKLLTKAYYQLLKEQRAASPAVEALVAASSNSLESRLAPTSGFEAEASSQGPRLGWDVLRQANLPQVQQYYKLTFLYIFRRFDIFVVFIL